MASRLGTIIWADLTVPNADEIRDFYSGVTGWLPEPVDMGGYADYSMLPPEGGEPAAGICHARGVNDGIPPFWMVYISVDDMTASLEACTRLGGLVVFGPRGEVGQRLAIIQDPAGAFAALVETGG